MVADELLSHTVQLQRRHPWAYMFTHFGKRGTDESVRLPHEFDFIFRLEIDTHPDGICQYAETAPLPLV